MSYKNKDLPDDISFETKLVRGGTLRSDFGESSEAIYMNSGFCYNEAETAEKRFNGEEPGYVYSRYINPNLKMLEDKLALIEGGESACVMASGMAAVFSSIMCQIKSSDHIIASRVLFGSCNYIFTNILPNYGIEVTLVDATKKESLKNAFKSNTKLVFIESPANPTIEIIDIEFVANLCKENKAKLIVDNIFSSPFCQKPLELGADIVVYSSTKHMDGQGRSLGGSVIGNEEFIKDTLLPFHRHTGPALSPFNAWIVYKSLETFALRMRQHCENAVEVAKFLESHNKIDRVLYPHLKSHPQYEVAIKQMKFGGSMISFEVKGGKEKLFKFMNSLKLVDISNNLGDTKSLITHPSTTTHSNMQEEDRLEIGIKDNSCRFSVGIESHQDIIRDLNQALDNSN